MGITQHPRTFVFVIGTFKTIEHSGPLDAIKSKKFSYFGMKKQFSKRLKMRKKVISQICHIFVDPLKVHCS